MELTNTLAVSNSGDLTRQITELCRDVNLPGPHNPQHLPTDLRNEQDSYEKQMQYHLGQALSLYHQKGAELQVKLHDWYETAYFYDADDLLKDPNWENYYPGVVISNKPYREFIEAEATEEANRRHLATLLLTRAISKRQEQQVLQRAQGLVCALDPRDDLFFSEQALEECLKKEQLGTDKAINTVLDRKPYTPVKKADRRNALAKVWTERRVETLKRNQFLFTDWEGDDTVFSTLAAVKTFTYTVIKRITDNFTGLTGGEFGTAFWDVLREATKLGDEDNYYLDPRDEDTWIGLRELGKALAELDQEAIHYAAHDGDYQGQTWLKEVGLPTLYGASADWWANRPNLEHDLAADNEGVLLLFKSNRTPYEEMVLFRQEFREEVSNARLTTLTLTKYEQQLQEVLPRA